MKKFISFLFIGLLGLVMLPQVVFAKQYDNLVKLPVDDAQQVELESMDIDGGELQLEETQGDILGVADNVISGPHFYFGEEVVLDENLVGDVYVAGGTVEVNGNIDGDLLVAGGTVTLNGQVRDDVRAAGGELYVNGTIGDDLTIAGGTIRFSQDASVGNSILAGGGTINLDGETLGNVLLGGGMAKLAGRYGADVNAQADTVRVMPGVVISGSLIAETGVEADISDEAQIMGEEVLTVTPREEKEKTIVDEKMSSVGGVLVKAVLVEFFIKLMIGIISGGVLIYFLPKLVNQVSRRVLESPMANLGWGLIYLFITPIVILFAMVSIVALPIAGIIALVYILSMIVASWVVAYSIGIKLEENLKVKALKNKYLSFATGLFVLSAIGFIPILGWLVKMVAFFIGFGAIFNMIKVNVLTRKKK